MLLVERYRPAPIVPTPIRRRCSRALGDRRVPDAGAVPGVSRSGATIVGGMLLGLDRRGGRGVLVLPGDADDGGGVCARSAGRCGITWRRSAPARSRVGFVMAFIASVLVVRPFLRFVSRVRLRAVRLVPHRARSRRIRERSRRDWAVVPPMQWLRRSFIAGFFVTVPLVISVAAFVWIFRLIDGFVGPFYERLLGSGRRHGARARHPDDGAGRAAGRRASPPTSSASGCCSGPRATCCWCRCSARSTRRSSSWSSRFRPDNEYGFKRVVLVEDRVARLRARVPDQGVHRRPRAGPRGDDRRLRADQPSLSRGRRSSARATRPRFPTSPSSRAIRIFLTGGMALSSRIRARRGDDRVGGLPRLMPRRDCAERLRA